MKNLFLALALATLPATTFAESARHEVETITGSEAKEMYLRMEGHVRSGGDTETTRQKFKVDRAEDGLSQTICIETFHDVGGEKSYRCKKEKSLDGKKLPEPDEFPEPRR